MPQDIYSQEEQLQASLMLQGILLGLLETKFPGLRPMMEEQLETSEMLMNSHGKEPRKSLALKSISCARGMLEAALPRRG